MTLMARYSGECPECGGRWQPGDLIRGETGRYPNGSPRWKHAVCPDALTDLTPRNPVCTTCWLDHPEGACDR